MTRHKYFKFGQVVSLPILLRNRVEIMPGRKRVGSPPSSASVPNDAGGQSDSMLPQPTAEKGTQLQGRMVRQDSDRRGS